jgi:hypothetical protein
VREGEQTLRHQILLAEGHLLPNTTIRARWRVVGEDGGEVIGPPTTVTYEDTRFEWQVREGELVRVHWSEGGDAFGARALEIGERAIRETAELLGVTEDEPVDFFVYADEQAFYDALGPGTRENVGGQANAELRTLFALIGPDEIDDAWVEIVIPHELVHLVFDTAVDNPYHFPPRWLNEGVAVYLSQGYEVSDRSAVEQAAGDGSLIPLEGLGGQFPTTRDRFFLAYAESVAAVDFLIAEHGRDALVQLVRSYATGLTDDEAFEQAIGMDVAAFDAAWRDDVGAGDPVDHGPRPAPAGPLPPGWTTAEGSPGATLPPGARPSGGTNAPDDGNTIGIGDPESGALVAVAAVGGVAILALALYALILRQRGSFEPAAEGPASFETHEDDATDVDHPLDRPDHHDHADTAPAAPAAPDPTALAAPDAAVAPPEHAVAREVPPPPPSSAPAP